MTDLLERARVILSGERQEVPDLGIEDPAAAEPGAELVDQLPELDPDPEPGRRTRKRSRAAASKATAARQTRAAGRFTSKASVQKAMADEIETYAKMLALTWSMTDPECAGVLNDTSANIARDLAALMARSEWITEQFTRTTMIGDCIKLLHSALPVCRAVYVHHVSTRGQQEQEEAHDAVSVADPERYAPYAPAYAR